jgi:YVTN family beta-propeller protein
MRRVESTQKRQLFTRMRCGASLLGGLALLATATPVTATSLAQAGPVPTLVVASVPDPTQLPGTGNVVQAFDSASQTELGQPGGVAVGSNPSALAITPIGSTAFVANTLSGTLTPVNLPGLGLQASLCMPIGNCAGGGDPATLPAAVAVTPDGTAAYVVNSGENSISLVAISNQTAKVVSPQISSNSFSDPDAIAITPDGKTAWVANYGSGTVVSVTIPGGRLGTPIAVGNNPTGLAVTPDGRHLLVANSGDGSVSDVTLTNLTVNTFSLEPTATGFVTPQAVAISPDGATAYVTDSANDVLVPIDIASDTPTDGALVDGDEPGAVAITPDGSQAYVANRANDSVSVLDLTGASPSVSGSIPTNGSPAALALTPDQAPMAAFSITPGTAGSPTSLDASASDTHPAGGTLAYAWNFGDGSTESTSSPTTAHTYANPGLYTVTLTVTDAAGTTTAVVFTGQTVSRNGGPAATTRQSFLVQGPASGAAPEALVAGSDRASATLVALSSSSSPSASPGLPTGVGSSPSAVAIEPTGRTAYVVDTGSNQVTPVDMSTGQAASTSKWITVGSLPNAIAITPDGRFAYVVNGGSTSVSKITLSTLAVSTINVPAAGGANLDAIAITPDGSKAYVLDAANNTITPITLASGAVGNPVGGSGLLAPVAIAIAPNGKAAYVVDGGTSTQLGGITSVDISGATPAPTATTTLGLAGDRPDAIAVNPSGTAAYVVTAPSNGHTASIVPLSLAGTAVTKRTAVAVSGSSGMFGIAVAPDGAAAYATARMSTGFANAIVPIGLNGSIVTPGSAAQLTSAPLGIAIVPDQAPVAELAVSSPVAAGAPGMFDASASSNPSSAIAGYAFDFGDGSTPASTTAPAASTTHPYAVAGTYTAGVTVTDRAGTSTAQVFTGQTVSRNGNANAVERQIVTVFPTLTSISPSSGPAGTKVTINGTGFSTLAAATKVMFGTAQGTSVSCASTIKCTATAPSGSGTVAVAMTVGGQTSPSAAGDQFTYASGTPTVTSISPTSGRVGTVVTIVGTGFSTASGTTTIKFGSTKSASVSCPTTTQCTASAPSSLQSLGVGTVDITVMVGTKTSPTVSADRFKYLR